MPRDSHASTGYWVVVFLLCLLGVVGIFSIGMPLLLLGATLAAVAPWRSQRVVLWPAVTAVVSFVVGYILVAPLSCTATASSAVSQGAMPPARSTTCTNVLGIDYAGVGSYDPSPLPALLVGLALSVLSAVAVRMILARRGRRRPAFEESTPMLSDHDTGAPRTAGEATARRRGGYRSR